MLSLNAFYLFATLVAALAIFPLSAISMEPVEVIGNVFLPFSFAAAACCGFTSLSSVWVRPHPALAAASVAAASIISASAACLLAFVLLVYCVVRNVGTFPEFVDRILDDEELRSALGPEYAKLRSEYKQQMSIIAGLNESVSTICKEQYKHWCTVRMCTAFAPRRQSWIHPAKYFDVEWSEPCVLAKMCKSLFCPSFQHDLSVASLFRV